MKTQLNQNTQRIHLELVQPSFSRANLLFMLWLIGMLEGIDHKDLGLNTEELQPVTNLEKLF